MTVAGVSVDLDRAAQSDPLAREIRRRVIAAAARPAVQRQFARMWGTVVLLRRSEFGCALGSPPPADLGSRPNLAPNREPHPGSSSNHGSAPSPELTLRFDYGTLVIHRGRVGRPDITLFGTDEDILSLGGGASEALLERALLGSMSVYLRALRAMSLGGPSGEGLRIFGRTAHPLFVARLGLLLSP